MATHKLFAGQSSTVELNPNLELMLRHPERSLFSGGVKDLPLDRPIA